MKKLKFKWFYLNSFVLYLVLIFIFSILTVMFLEQISYNFLVSNFAATKHGSSNILEIVVDDYSIQENKKNWTRGDYADILAFLDEYTKAKVIGFDTTITSFDEKNPDDRKLLKQISSMDNLVSGFLPEVTNGETDKAILPILKANHSLNFKSNTTHSTIFNGVRSSSDLLLKSTKHYGSVLVETSSTLGSLNSVSNVVKIGDSYYPSLSLKMYLLENGINEVSEANNYLHIDKTGLSMPYIFKSEGLFKTKLRFYRNINSDYSHLAIPAYTIKDTYYALKSGITPKTHPELFKPGKYIDPAHFDGVTVFVGANISGPTADVFKTPMAKRHPGVDIQATAYDNLKSNYFIHSTGFGVSFLIFAILSLASFVIILRAKFIRGLLTIALLDLVFMIAVFIAATQGYILSYAVPLVCQFVTAVFAYSFKFISENRNKEKIKQAMGKYLSQDVMKNVVSNIDDLKLGGKRAVVTVLFSDIRGFTSLSEKMSAEEVSMILNEYFAEMEPIISKYNGVINKFIGDAVMAIFGEPIQDINHSKNAVKCAYEMLKKVEYLREKWLYEGKPKIEIGVGINTGEVFIGNIGTETRMEYTVIGDTVNLASRIESYNKVYKTNLLVSSSTYEAIADIADVIKISEVQIRGKAKKMNIYEVLRIDKNG